ncbi:hypothetical protein [Mycoplasma sp. P36-A1]|uniref:hypothetical protein n=1 Tax=Mycoplasma sp. P36-A1 TaxID=3252900 RepID=UPI003C2DDB4F
MCENINKKNDYSYDLSNILLTLIYSRIFNPCSKSSSFTYSQSFIEQSTYKIHDLYRSLSVLADNKEYIQAQVYKNSLKVIDRNPNSSKRLIEAKNVIEVWRSSR